MRLNGSRLLTKHSAEVEDNPEREREREIVGKGVRASLRTSENKSGRAIVHTVASCSAYLANSLA